MSLRNDTALVKLAREISLNRPFQSLHEAALLAYVWTWQRMEQVGREFFEHFDLTGAQFDVLMILADHPGRAFRQHELAQMLLVNRATAGSVLERMERKGLLARSADPEDRRAMRVTLTRKGRQTLDEVKPRYYALMSKLLGREEEKSLRQVIGFCDRLRDAIAGLQTAKG
ncbi:MAG TPA: MarR family transcriptional regulator [Usitatibacter sp.]|nr:MarR family transcriptional regulator [Usitatibacter sp.]